MAWVDVRKAYYPVEHQWLKEMFNLDLFPRWIGDVIGGLKAKSNTKVTFKTK